MSIYIAFFSLFAAVIVLDALARLRIRNWTLRPGVYAVCAGLLVLGALDENPRSNALDYAAVKREYVKDAAFVKQIEDSLPPGAMVFQLPYKSFPESGATCNLHDYEPFRGYLHSKTLRWSYGAMRNRELDLWQAAVVQKPVPELLETLALAGFSGIYIDRSGYLPGAADALEKHLSNLLGGCTPLVNANNRVSFFNLTAYRQELRRRYPENVYQSKRKAALYPLAETMLCPHSEDNARSNELTSSAEGNSGTPSPQICGVGRLGP